MDYEFVPVETTKEALSDYVRLFDVCYPRGTEKYSDEYMSWQYADNPAGGAIGFDALHEGTRVAHYVVVPSRYRLASGEEVLGAVSLNTVTHPEHRGKGLFPQLARRTYDLARESGCELITGVANQYSFKGFVKKLGFTALGQISLRYGFTGSLCIEEERAAGMRHSDESLRWRLANPSRSYTPALMRSGRIGLWTRVGKFSYFLGQFDPTKLPEAYFPATADSKDYSRGSRVSLAPMKGFPVGATLRVPNRALPSPWQLIGLSLRGRDAGELFADFAVLGLDMDTF